MKHTTRLFVRHLLVALLVVSPSLRLEATTTSPAVAAPAGLTSLSDAQMEGITGGQDAYDVNCYLSTFGGAGAGAMYLLEIEVPLLVPVLAVSAVLCGASVAVDHIWDQWGAPLAGDIYDTFAPGWGLQQWRSLLYVYGSYTCGGIGGPESHTCVNNFRFSTEIDGVREDWYCGTDSCLCDNSDDCDAEYDCMEPGDATGPVGTCHPYFCVHTPC